MSNLKKPACASKQDVLELTTLQYVLTLFVISKHFITDNTQYLHQICISIYTGLYMNWFVNKNYVLSGIPFNCQILSNT